MRLPARHDALIERIAAEHRRVVVVLSNGSPVEMPWVDQFRHLEGYLGGQAGASAVAAILTGQDTPQASWQRPSRSGWKTTRLIPIIPAAL